MTFNLPACSRAISSTTGATIRHGPHHTAQKSTSVGVPDFSTSWLNVSSVTTVGIAISLLYRMQSACYPRLYPIRTRPQIGDRLMHAPPPFLFERQRIQVFRLRVQKIAQQ